MSPEIFSCQTPYGEAVAKYPVTIPTGERGSEEEFCEDIENARVNFENDKNDGETWETFICSLKSGVTKVQLPFATDLEGMQDICITLSKPEFPVTKDDHVDIYEFGLIAVAGLTVATFAAAAIIKVAENFRR